MSSKRVESILIGDCPDPECGVHVKMLGAHNEELCEASLTIPEAKNIVARLNECIYAHVMLHSDKSEKS